MLTQTHTQEDTHSPALPSQQVAREQSRWTGFVLMETESSEQEKEKGLCMSWVSAVKLLFQLIKLHDRMIRHF